MKFNLNKENVLKILKLNNAPSENSASPELLKARKNIYLQAGLAVLTIVLTLVVLFSMTAAWYTNIVQTSGLVFEVESWGYDGAITIGEGPVNAGPGDSGVVEITMSGGENRDVLEASVSVSTKLMEEEMMKRIFFYVDTPKEINGETLERVYVSSEEDFEYTVFSGGSILMSEDFSNVPELKWQWVYDVLGYYVLADETKDGDKVTGITITEYLRPIEYDFDKATFKDVTETLTTTDGEEKELNSYRIKTVDGDRTPEQFLEEFSKKDGYPEEINAFLDEGETEDDLTPTVTYKDGTYYYVGEREDGKAIYAYLCSYSEIEAATQYDTYLGKLAKEVADKTVSEGVDTSVLTFEAKVTVSVEQKNIEPVSVSDKAAFINAIKAAEDGAFIKLESSIGMGTEFVDIPEGAEVWIDLNGNTITSSASDNATQKGAIYAAEGSSVTLLNGSIEGTDAENSWAIESVGAEINISGVDISNFKRAVSVSDEKSPYRDSTIRIYNCRFDVDYDGVFISGNGPETEQKTQLIIENSTIISKEYGISGNGSENKIGTDIRIINSIVESTGADWGAAIYHPQGNSTLSVYKSILSGYNGIAIKGGSIEIINSEIYGEAKSTVENFTASQSGYADTGDAVYIENNYLQNSISLVIKQNESADGENILKSTKLESEKNYALRVYDKTLGNVKIVIYKGTFVGLGSLEASWIDDGSKQVEIVGGIEVTPATLVEETE